MSVGRAGRSVGGESFEFRERLAPLPGCAGPDSRGRLSPRELGISSQLRASVRQDRQLQVAQVGGVSDDFDLRDFPVSDYEIERTEQAPTRSRDRADLPINEGRSRGAGQIRKGSGE